MKKGVLFKCIFLMNMGMHEPLYAGAAAFSLQHVTTVSKQHIDTIKKSFSTFVQKCRRLKKNNSKKVQWVGLVTGLLFMVSVGGILWQLQQEKTAQTAEEKQEQLIKTQATLMAMQAQREKLTKKMLALYHARENREFEVRDSVEPLPRNFQTLYEQMDEIVKKSIQDRRALSLSKNNNTCSDQSLVNEKRPSKTQPKIQKPKQPVISSTQAEKKTALQDLVIAENESIPGGCPKESAFIARALNVLFKGIETEGEAWALMLEPVSMDDITNLRTINSLIESLAKYYTLSRSENGIFLVVKK